MRLKTAFFRKRTFQKYLRRLKKKGFLVQYTSDTLLTTDNQLNTALAQCAKIDHIKLNWDQIHTLADVLELASFHVTPNHHPVAKLKADIRYGTHHVRLGFVHAKDFFLFLANMTSDQLGHDANRMLERYTTDGVLDPTQFYIDMYSKDSARQMPKPRYEQQLRDNPKLGRIIQLRQENLERFDQEQQDYFKQCKNTFEVGVQHPNHPMATERYDTLREMNDLEVEPMSDDDMILLLTHAMCTQCEFDTDQELVIAACTVSYEQLLMQGTKNSSGAGLHYDIAADGKSSAHVVGAIEAMEEVIRARDIGHCVLRPSTMMPKDERVKPEKKQKQFQPQDMALQKLHMALHGSYSDMMSGRIDLGVGVGVPSNGTCLNAYTRYIVGHWEGVPMRQVTDELLEKVEAMQSDFVGFEYHHHPSILVATELAKVARYAGGCRNATGQPQPHMGIVLGSLAENIILHDLRVGENLCLMLPPFFRASGHKDTLTDNTINHMYYLLMAARKLQDTVPDEVPHNSPEQLTTMKVGDDGVSKATTFIKAVFSNIANGQLAPVKMTLKGGPLISKLGPKCELLNNGVSFCKVQMHLEDGVIIARRTFQNMHKIVLGNTTSLELPALMASSISHAYHSYGSPVAYDCAKAVYELCAELAGVKRLPPSMDQQLMQSSSITRVDIAPSDGFPTHEDIKYYMFGRDSEKVHVLMQNAIVGKSLGYPYLYAKF